jgi:hypothetical protein
MEIALDLPRDQLIEWIKKQLAAGVRNVPQVPGSEAIVDKLEEILIAKRDIIRLSRQLADKSLLALTEKWRCIELQHALIRAQFKLRKTEYQENCIKRNEYEEEINENGVVTVKLTGPDFVETVAQPTVAAFDRLTNESETVWKEVYEKLTQLMKRREQEMALIEKSLSSDNNSVYEFLVKKRDALLDDYLHERHLLKKQKETRASLEQSMRDKIASLSTELHAIRDMHRVKQVIQESRLSDTKKQIETGERMIEWQLMEEQIRIEREINDVEARYRPKIERVRREIAKVSEIARVEAQVMEQKTGILASIKEEINLLRRDTRDIETAISQFRTVLRKDEKLKREQAKVLRE